MKMKFTPKIAKVVLLIVFTGFSLSLGISQTSSTWVGTGSAWLTASNWNPSGVPTATNTIAVFDLATQNAGINMNGSTNNGTNNQGLGALRVVSTRTSAMNIGNSSTAAAGILTLTGTTVNSVGNTIIANESGQNLNIQQNTGTGTQAMSLALGNSTDNIVSVTGAGLVTISVPIIGTNKLTKQGAGSGTLTLTGANTYIGLTTVSAGTLRLNRTGGTTLPSSNDVTIAGGTLKVSTNQTLNNLTLTSGTLLVDAGVTLTINGTLTVTSGTVTINGATAYGSSATILYNGSTIQTTGAELPSSIANITINNAANVRLNTNVTVTNLLTVSAGSFNLFGNTLTIAGVAPSIASGSTLNATANAPSKVIFANTSPITLPAVTFTNTSTANNIEMNGSGGVVLSSALNIATSLTLTNGNINLGANNLTIGASGTITGGSATSYIATDGVGALICPAVAGIATALPVGTAASYDPVSVTATDATIFTINVKSSFTNVVSNPTKAAEKEWNIASSAPSSTSISFTPINPIASATPKIGHFTGGVWTEVAASRVGNTWTGTVSSFSPFGVGEQGGFVAVLPVALSKFEAKNTHKSALLTWATSSERENAYFEVQHSTNGIGFNTIAEVKGQGTTNTETDYNYTHSTPSVGTNYYRLKQVDYNNMTSFSAIRSIVFVKGNLSLFSNLAQSTIDIATDSNDCTTVSIYNIAGQEVITQKIQVRATIDISNLQNGLYIVRTNTGTTARFVKQ